MKSSKRNVQIQLSISKEVFLPSICANFLSWKNESSLKRISSGALEFPLIKEGKFVAVVAINSGVQLNNISVTSKSFGTIPKTGDYFTLSYSALFIVKVKCQVKINIRYAADKNNGGVWAQVLSIAAREQ